MEIQYNAEEENKNLALYKELTRIQARFMASLQIGETLKKEKEELEEKIAKLEKPKEEKNK